MKICLIGNNLSNLVLAKVLLRKKIKIDLFYQEIKKVEKTTRTIGISKNNVDFFNKNIFDLKKKYWRINEIKIFNETNKKKELLNFKSYNTAPFFIVEYDYLIKKINDELKNEKNFRKYKINKNTDLSNLLNKNYQIIINSDKNNFITTEYFFKRVTKDYKSTAHTVLIEHKKCINRIAIQIFTKFGPLAFLPISNTKTSVVFSFFDQLENYNDNEIKKYIMQYNFNYKIKSLSHIEKFKLTFSFPKNYRFKNILLFGDVLHQVHPLAGQGFNIILRDIKIFSSLIDKRIDLGLPIDSTVLSDFESKIKHSNVIFASGIDLVHEFFKFDNRFNNYFSEKFFKYLKNNKLFNKYASKLANEGITF